MTNTHEPKLIDLQHDSVVSWVAAWKRGDLNSPLNDEVAALLACLPRPVTDGDMVSVLGTTDKGEHWAYFSTERRFDKPTRWIGPDGEYRSAGRVAHAFFLSGEGTKYRGTMPRMLSVSNILIQGPLAAWVACHENNLHRDDSELIEEEIYLYDYLMSFIPLDFGVGACVTVDSGSDMTYFHVSDGTWVNTTANHTITHQDFIRWCRESRSLVVHAQDRLVALPPRSSDQA